MYLGLYAICVLNWNWWLTQDHFLIKHWSQRTYRCSARVVGLEEYSLVLVSRYSTVRSGTLTWREWGLCSKQLITATYFEINNTDGSWYIFANIYGKWNGFAIFEFCSISRYSYRDQIRKWNEIHKVYILRSWAHSKIKKPILLGIWFQL